MEKYLLPMNLQHFSEDGGGEAASTDSGGDSQSMPQSTINFSDEVPEYQGGLEPMEDEKNVSSFTDQNFPQEMGDQNDQTSQQASDQTGDQASQQASQELTEFDFGGRKVKPGDPDSIKGAYEDFQNAQRTITQLQQQTKQYEQFLQMLNNAGVLPNQDQQGQMMNNQQQFGQNQNNPFNAQMQQSQQPQQQEAPSPSQERMAELHEEYMNRMYENKFEADKWWAEQPEVQAWERQRYQQYVQPMIEPIQQERETQQRLQQMQQKYQDFEQYVPKMQKLLDERPELNQVEQLENVYWIAKAQALEEQQSQTPQPDQLMQDPNFQQQVAQNPTIVNQVLSQHLQNKQQQQRQTPPVMGRQAGGASPTFQQRSPRTIKEAGKYVRRNWGIY